MDTVFPIHRSDFATGAAADVHYDLKRMDASEFLRHLEKRMRVQHGPEQRVERWFYDTFDWRVYEAGYLLSLVKKADGTALHLAARNNALPALTLPLDKMPRFAWDLPESSLRQQIQGIIKMRALLPQVSVISAVIPVHLLNKQDKIVVRLEIGRSQVLKDGADTGKTLEKRLRILPVKGYRQPLNRLLTLLDNDLRLDELQGNVFDRALSCQGREAMDYSAKLDFRLPPETPADQAMKIMLRHLFTTLRANETGIKQDIDTEFLHDYRIAVRRTRTVLRQIKGVLPKDSVEYATTEFSWLGQVTSQPRDLDVYLLNFEDYQGLLPPDRQDDLDPLRKFLQKRRTQAYKLLVKELASPRYQRIVQKWAECLVSPVSAHPRQPNASLPILTVASRRIWRIYKKVIHEGSCIDDATAPERLHELRKNCKQLRYMMELFQGAYPKSKIKQMIKVLKRLQDNLGEFQDLSVQQAMLTKLSDEMQAANAIPAATLLAMGMLVQTLDQRQRQVRAEFTAQFESFQSKAHRNQFKSLFRVSC